MAAGPPWSLGIRRRQTSWCSGMRALGRRIEQYFRPQAWGKRPVADLRAGNGEFSIGARFELARCRLPPAVFWRRGDLRVRPFYFDRCSPGQRRRLLGPLLTFIREVHVSQVGRDGPPMLVPLPVFIGTGSGTRPGETWASPRAELLNRRRLRNRRANIEGSTVSSQLSRAIA